MVLASFLFWLWCLYFWFMYKHYVLRVSVSLHSCRIYLACSAHAPYYIVICVLSGCIIFFQIILKNTIFVRKKKKCWIQNVCFDFLYNFSLKIFLFSKEFSKMLSWMYRGLRVKYSFSDFHRTWISSTYFRETPNYQISWKPIRCESRCSIGTDGWTDKHETTVVLRNFAHVSKEKLKKNTLLICHLSLYLFAFYFCGLGCRCVFRRPPLLAFSGLVWWVTFTIIQQPESVSGFGLIFHVLAGCNRQWSARIVLIKTDSDYHVFRHHQQQ